jgi:hydroxypyruvate isomerase
MTMALKFSVADWCFFEQAGLPPPDFYGRLRDMGYEGVEMVGPDRMNAAGEAGMHIINLTTFQDCMPRGLNRPEEHPRLLPRIREAMNWAATQNIDAVIVFSGNRMGQNDDDGLNHCRTALEALMPEAERLGVTLLLEVFNMYDHEDYQADNSRYAFNLARAVNSPRMKVLYDIYHMEMMGERVADTLVRNIDLVGHLHVAEAGNRSCPRPNGAIPYERIVSAVTAAGYNGYWGMEFHPNGNPFAELTRAKAFFESIVS